MPRTSPFEEMKQDHESVLQEMRELRETLRGLSGKGPRGWGDVGRVVRDRLEMFRRDLRLHIRREEDAVFPEARRLLSEDAGRVDVIGSFFAGEAEDDVAAHATLAARADEMLTMVAEMGDSGGATEQSLRKLAAVGEATARLLEQHAAKEDSLIFPFLERTLTEDQVDAVRAELQRLGSARDLIGSEESDEELRELGGGD